MILLCSLLGSSSLPRGGGGASSSFYLALRWGTGGSYVAFGCDDSKTCNIPVNWNDFNKFDVSDNLSGVHFIPGSVRPTPKWKIIFMGAVRNPLIEFRMVASLHPRLSSPDLNWPGRFPAILCSSQNYLRLSLYSPAQPWSHLKFECSWLVSQAVNVGRTCITYPRLVRNILWFFGKYSCLLWQEKW